MAVPRHCPLRFRSWCGNYILGLRPVKRGQEKPVFRPEIHFAGWPDVLAGGAFVAETAARLASSPSNFFTTSATKESARIGGRPGSERAMPIWSRLAR